MGVVMVLCLVAAALFWPLMVWLPTEPVLAWIAEVLWVIFLVWFVIALNRANGQRRRVLEAAAFEESQRLEGLRETARVTNAPWLDPRINAYVHGSCTMRHRSEGAAARCRSTV